MELVERFLAGDRRALARAITMVENGGPESGDLIRSVFSRSGRAQVIGVTGPPGAGKSTLVDHLASEFRARGRTVGIIAIDPTSPFTGGAILGDRIRMQRGATDPGVFIRSLATRGHLGGVSMATGDVIALMDAFGFDPIIVETVGAGQSEVDIMRLAHTTVVVLVPGLGDDIQAIKAGILEIGDIFAVNKADREGADRTARELEVMLDMNPAFHPGGPGISGGQGGETGKPGGAGKPGESGKPTEFHRWRPPVLKTVARDGVGVGDLAARAEDHLQHLKYTGRLEERQVEDARLKLNDIMMARLAWILMDRVGGELDQAALAVAEREVDPYTAAQRLLNVHCPCSRKK